MPLNISFHRNSQIYSQIFVILQQPYYYLNKVTFKKKTFLRCTDLKLQDKGSKLYFDWKRNNKLIKSAAAGKLSSLDSYRIFPIRIYSFHLFLFENIEISIYKDIKISFLIFNTNLRGQLFAIFHNDQSSFVVCLLVLS